jgi:hypothetical protein
MPGDKMPHEKPKNATSARNSSHSIEKYPFSVLKDPFKANIRELESAIGNLQSEAFKASGETEGNTYALLAANLIRIYLSRMSQRNISRH